MGKNQKIGIRSLMTSHSNWVLGLAFSPAGTLLASCSKDKSIIVWDTTTGSAKFTLRGHDGKDGCLCTVTKDAIGQDQIVVNACCPVKGHSSSVFCVTFSKNGRFLVSGGGNSELFVWDANTGECVRPLNGHSNVVSCVAFGPCDVLTTGSWDNTVGLWDIRSDCLVNGESKVAYSREIESVEETFLKKLRAGLQDASRYMENRLKQPIFHYGCLSKEVQSRVQIEIQLTSLSGHDGKGSCVCGPRPYGVEPVKPDCPVNGHSGSVRGVAWSADGAILASCSDDKSVITWSKDGSKVRTLRGHDGKAPCICGLNAQHDGAKPNCPVTGHSSTVSSVAFGPGRVLASGSWDCTIGIWDVNSGNRLRSLKGHSSYVLCVAFSKVGRFLVSGSGHAELFIWDVNTGECVRTLNGHKHPLSSVAWSSDGELIASGSGDVLGRGNEIMVHTKDDLLKWTVNGHAQQ